MQRARRLSALYIKTLRCSHRFPKAVLYQAELHPDKKHLENRKLRDPECSGSLSYFR
jgi:hypothetical protein